MKASAYMNLSKDWASRQLNPSQLANALLGSEQKVGDKSPADALKFAFATKIEEKLNKIVGETKFKKSKIKAKLEIKVG